MTTLTKGALNDLDRIKHTAKGPFAIDKDGAGASRFPVDICETPDTFVLKADLPGVSRDDLKVQIFENRLQISGLRRVPEKVRYTRVFHLPEAVSGVQPQAHLKDGVLTMNLPKPDRMKAVHIPVTADSGFTI